MIYNQGYKTNYYKLEFFPYFMISERLKNIEKEESLFVISFMYIFII